MTPQRTAAQAIFTAAAVVVALRSIRQSTRSPDSSAWRAATGRRGAGTGRITSRRSCLVFRFFRNRRPASSATRSATWTWTSVRSSMSVPFPQRTLRGGAREQHQRSAAVLSRSTGNGTTRLRLWRAALQPAVVFMVVLFPCVLREGCVPLAQPTVGWRRRGVGLLQEKSRPTPAPNLRSPNSVCNSPGDWPPPRVARPRNGWL